VHEEHERAALELCEAMTLIGDGHVPDPVWDRGRGVRREGADSPDVRDRVDQLVEPALHHGSGRAGDYEPFVMVAVGGLAMLVAVRLFQRRDLTGA
jgi:hypothetical protein